jgi:hypothetical protein
MSLTKRVGLVAGATALTLTGASFGGTSEANDQDLRARIAQMEAELAKLQAQSGQEWLTEERAAEIRALVNDVLMDADTRASLLADNGTAGWDDSGFYLASADGNYRLDISGLIQFRYILNLQDDDEFVDNDSTRGGFENSRTKVIFSGNVVSPDTTYKVEGDFGQSGTFGLKDAWVKHQMDSGWYLQAGQFKGPFLREELVDAGMQQAVERSFINGVFTADRTQGIMLGTEGENFRFAASFNDGGRTPNTPALMYDTEYSFDARAELKTSGEWSQFDDFSSWNGGPSGVMFGLAGHIQKDEAGTSAGGVFGTTDATIWAVTGDVSVEFGGANLYGAIVYADLDDDTASIDVNPLGVVAQGGIFLSDDIELFGRFEWGDHDVDLGGAEEDLMLLTIGVTKFWAEHDLKWTTDVGFSFEPLDPVWSSVNPDMGLTGWRPDPTDDTDQIVIRSQLQLRF